MNEDLGAAGLRFEREGVIAWCIIDRPEARNALTGAMYYGIKKAVLRVDQDPDLAALIITGTGDVFAPGGDLGGREPDPRDAPTPEVGSGESLPFTAIRESRKPVIAAVNGICQGGGLLIAMMADIAVVSDRSTFRVPELLRGIIDATYAYTLPVHVGMARARDLLVSARRFGAQEALDWGLISRVVPHEELREAALEAAGEVLQTAPVARMHVKRMLNQRYGLIDYPTMMWGLAESPEPREGFTAFMEKRAPGWIPSDFVGRDGRR
jgi:enoyl-CoA hydratase/carnithine racemase